MKKSYVSFDIETIADIDRAKALMPKFDESEVKVGNLGPDKAAQKIAELKARHEQDWLEKAALRAETARVALIGYEHLGSIEIVTCGGSMQEADVLSTWWHLCRGFLLSSNLAPMVGYYSRYFDLPFLVRRSWILGVAVPSCIWGWKRGLADEFIDLYDIWKCGDFKAEPTGGMDGLCRIMGVKGKNGSGANFGKMWAEGKTAECIDYLKNDVRCVSECAERMGIEEITGRLETKQRRGQYNDIR
jgi:hypothetical protein